MAKIAIVMGSESDRELASEAIPYLNFFGIDTDVMVMSAHRTPGKVREFAENAEKNQYQAIIACAGLAAHLPGVIAAYTTLPVIGVPLPGGALNGQDALYSIVQMPAGVPVASMAIGKAGARNAGIFAAQIIAGQDENVRNQLIKFKENQCRIPR